MFQLTQKLCVLVQKDAVDRRWSSCAESTSEVLSDLQTAKSQMDKWVKQPNTSGQALKFLRQLSDFHPDFQQSNQTLITSLGFIIVIGCPVILFAKLKNCEDFP